MLRITQQGAIFQLEGRLAGEWVRELDNQVGPALSRGTIPTLDLSRVSYVDAWGHQLLRGLIAKGTRIGACSRFVAELLRREPP